MPAIATPDIPTYAVKEQRKPETQTLARRIKDIGNAIIKENHLETQPNGSNLAGIINGDDPSRPEHSFSALQLKAVIDQGLTEGRGIVIKFRNIDKEPGLKTAYGQDIAYGLTKEFLTKLNAVLPTDREGWEKIYDRERNVVTISDPRKPFYAECNVDGTASNGEPNLIGFTLIPKDVELLAAA